ncbi:MAG: hypothetical protein A2X23_01055 [Chloroflexi bacterium GWC2_73_18]|nr:MAG: hypothetical protein A2X23_01055 [Chloroflexi bacterium GWC2_73_18]
MIGVTMICPACGTENRPGQRFCGECGTRLGGGICTACGSAYEGSPKYCGECGSPLRPGVAVPVGATPPPVEPAATGARGASQAERRLVTVLFADLVGFTGLAETQDPEAVRELLTRYFALARERIGRYGGTVEKFIGDAVMAVWGAPTAHEDDAERAVRAALDLVEVIAQLRPADGEAPLQLRAGILTGEAAVTLGADGQGMVAGDLVNTASRLQAVAPPGSVLVGEGTHGAAGAAIVFEPVGEQQLKGKSLPVPAWRAVRVVAGRRGAGRTERLEAPFVGRDEELRLLKDLFHATAREGRARLLSVLGQPGIGKSRLAWEFEKYIDGLVETVYWHHGRSPAYGEGVTFWALGEMVRRRAGIAESDEPVAARVALVAMLAQYVPDEAERRWIEPHLAHLLGLDEAPAGERAELFAAWRTLFERVADRGPTVLVFEDLQWADAGLIDFVEELLEWSRNRPIFVIALARPELLERRPAWGREVRNFTGIRLEPLSDEAMRRLLIGLAPGLPEGAVTAILERAEGVPLYAIETVRMLLDQGQLVGGDDGYRLVGSVERLAVPATLHALIAARLDALAPAERELLQDAAVLGQSFAAPALAAVTGQPLDGVEGRLRAMVRRELLRLDEDPRSPERGQYQFVQGLIREIAYGTLARRGRLERHLAVARHLAALGDEELAGAVADHYLRAHQAAGSDPDAPALAEQARSALLAAAGRAGSLHSYEQAIAWYEQALRVATDGVEQTEIRERAAEEAIAASRFDLAERYLREAIAWHEGRGDRSAAARATARLGVALILGSRIEPAVVTLEAALADLPEMESDPEVVDVVAELARAYLFRGEHARALELIDRALPVAERHDRDRAVVELLISRVWAIQSEGRYLEGEATGRGALALAQRRGLLFSEFRARMNLSNWLFYDDPREALEVARAGYELALRFGLEGAAGSLFGNAAESATPIGDWDWILAVVAELRPRGSNVLGLLGVAFAGARILAFRGDVEQAHARLAQVEGLVDASTSWQDLAVLRRTESAVLLAEGRLAEAHEAAVRAAEGALLILPETHVSAARAALWLGDRERLAAAAANLEHSPGRGRWLENSRRVARAGLAAIEGRVEEAAGLYGEAAGRWRELDLPFELAMTGLDAAAALGAGEPQVAGLIDEARVVLGRLGAAPFLARLEAATGAPA